VRLAFLVGMDTMLWVCCGITCASILLALLFLPRRSRAIVEPAAEPAQSEREADREHLQVA
jgi:hypothetical protein